MKLNRREFLGWSAVGLLGATALKGCQTNRNSVQGNGNEIQVYRSENGVLEVNLTAGYNDLVLAEQSLPQMMTYNGNVPAPRLEVNPGDHLIIHLTNNLDQATNLHFHGLHLSPEGNQDNPFLHIAPNETVTYELKIHPEQRGGTYWYHPHLHGSVAEQLFRGLAGIIVVRGELDERPEIRDAQEEFLLLQDFALGDTTNQTMNLMAGREGSLRLVNGQYHPTITVTKDLLRLRLVNASPSRFYNLELKGQQPLQIANDGGALAQPKAIDKLLLVPGQRAELLIPTAGLPNIPIHLLNLPYERASVGMMGNQAIQTIEAIADFQKEVTAPADIIIPEQFSPIKLLPKPKQTRQFTLNHGMTPGQGMAFLINDESYSGEVQTEVILDTVEDWEITNTGTMDHPFHIHVNKFQVISRNGIPEEAIAWHDTILVQVGETVTIRMIFEDFVGETVYHCHILDHEDLGMMGKLKILPALT